jgi:hypothetical protein
VPQATPSRDLRAISIVICWLIEIIVSVPYQFHALFSAITSNYQRKRVLFHLDFETDCISVFLIAALLEK